MAKATPAVKPSAKKSSVESAPKKAVPVLKKSTKKVEPEPEPEKVIEVPVVPEKPKPAAAKTKGRPKKVVQDDVKDDAEPAPAPVAVKIAPKPRSKPAPKKAVVANEDENLVELENDPAQSDEQATSGSSESPAEKETKVTRVFELVPGSIKPQDGAPEIDTATLHKNDNGRYDGKSGPLSAAKKAFRRIAKGLDDQTVTYIFSIREKKGGKTKTYIGTRTKLDEPKLIPNKNKPYEVKYDCKVKLYREPKDDE